MKKLAATLLLAIVACFFAPPEVGAAVKRETVIRSATGFACGTVNDGVIHILVDASAIDDCDATAGGSTSAVCLCDSGSAVAVSAIQAGDLSAYALLTGANFVGPVTMAEDRGVAGDEAISWGTELDLDTSYFSVAATDSDGDAYTTYIGQDGVNYGLWIVPPGATNPSVTLEQSGQLLIDPDDDGIADMNITGSQICLGGACFYGARGGPGALPCDAGSAGSHYYDNNGENQPCFCNGTAYVLYSDATTACTDPE